MSNTDTENESWQSDTARHGDVVTASGSLRKAFDCIAPGYEAWASVQGEIGDRLLARLDGLKLKPAAVVDAGCGPGRFAHRLAECYPQARVLALDFSTAMLDQARPRWWQRRRFELLQAEIGQLPLAESSVDLMFSSLVLPWCTDLPGLLNGFRRVLKPGGLVLLSTFGPDTLRAQRDASEASAFGSFVDVQRLGDAMMRAGFVEPVLDTDWITSLHRDAGALWRQLTGAGVVLTDQPPPAGWDESCRAGLDDQGRVRAEWEAVYGSAWAPQEGAPIRTTHGEEASVSVASIGRRRR
ncbi:MAG: methyltransferase domain-containing protein [Wenzhouxiangellaceae bacterium]